MKKLNNKGFTLVELLAVVVILAVVMGIAMTSVLSSMNNSRKGALSDSAISVKNAFTNKYSEAMVTGAASKVYGEEMELPDGAGYDFNTASTSAPVFYFLNEDLKDELNISPSTYMLENADTTGTVTLTSVDKSFVAFNGNNVVVCMVANQSGSYYVANFATKGANGANVSIFGKTVTFKDGTMWSCSIDGQNSWTVAANEVTG